MSGTDADGDRAEELTALYRAANAADTARPSDAVRRSILEYARSVSGGDPSRGRASAPARKTAANYPSWRMSAAASVIVAGFATLLAWHFRAPTSESPQEPVRALANIPADHQAAAADSPIEGPAGPAPGPNAVTARSSERRFADEEAGRVASSRQAPPRVARASAAQNATEARSASDARAPEYPVASTQLAPAAAPPAANVEPRQPPAQEAASAARAGAAPGSPLVTAAESGDLERVDQLLRSGIGTEQADARGRTALLVATLRGDVPMVRRLLAAGARVDAIDADGNTALATARRQGLRELEQLLERAAQQR